MTNEAVKPRSFLTRTMPGEEVSHLLISLMCASVGLSIWQDFITIDSLRTPMVAAAALVCSLVSLRMLHVGVDRAIALAGAAVVAYMVINFPESANHHWLFLWLIAPLIWRPDLAPSEGYSRYVTTSFGLMMIAAGVQKLGSGNYLDGSFLTYLANQGSVSERLLGLLCAGPGSATDMQSCGAIIFASWLAVAWQFIIGTLLLAQIRHPLVFLLEVGFVLGVGTVADELSFQCLSVCALMIASRLPMPVWFPSFVVALKAVAIVGVGNVILFMGVTL